MLAIQIYEVAGNTTRDLKIGKIFSRKYFKPTIRIYYINAPVFKIGTLIRKHEDIIIYLALLFDRNLRYEREAFKIAVVITIT